MRFYLGTHHPHWLARAGVPLFLSYSELRKRKALPRAIAPWACDSMGFTQLSTHGRWTITAEAYARAVERFQREIGMLDFASIQDWMCEPFVLAKTGLTVEEHQRRSIDSWLELRTLAPGVPWLPVLQGWTFGDYIHHAELYDAADRSWRDGPVGVGSVCRRQATVSASSILAVLASEGLRLHGFGFKKTGLLNGAARHLTSSDSLAWSENAYRNPQDAAKATCRETHKTCANCLPYALAWREELLGALDRVLDDRSG